MAHMAFNGEPYVDTACVVEVLSAFADLFGMRFAMLSLDGAQVAGDWEPCDLPAVDDLSPDVITARSNPDGASQAFILLGMPGVDEYILVAQRDAGASPIAEDRVGAVLLRVQGLIRVALQKELQLQGLANETLVRYEELNLLYEMGETIISDSSIDEIVSRMLERAVESTDAEGGAIVLLEEAAGGNELIVRASVGWSSESVPAGLRFGLGDGAIGNAIAQRRPQVSVRVLDRQLYGKPEAPVLLRSVMSVPLATTARLIGGMVLVNKSHGSYFTASDEKLGLAAATQAAIAIENNRLLLRIREEARIGASLRRYVSPNVVLAVLERGGLQELIGDRWRATVLFVDIVDFSVIVEQTPPEVMIALLNEYFRAVTDIIFKHQGAIDEFAGDELLAFFGIPYASPQGAEDAVRAAIEISARIDELRADWERRGLPTFDAGLGMNTGWVAVGNIGSERRMELTVVGPPVVVASRVEHLNRDLGTRILVTQETLDEVHQIVEYRSVGEHVLKGISKPAKVYEILGLRSV